MLMGVQVDQIDEPFEANLMEVAFEANLTDVTKAEGRVSSVPAQAKWAYVIDAGSNAAFKAVAKLQAAKVPVHRSAVKFELAGKSYDPGAWIVPSSAESTRIIKEVSAETGLVVVAADRPIEVDAFRLKPETRIGLWRGANNMPGGWMKWLFEQYGFNHRVVESGDFTGELSTLYDAIVLPSGISRDTIVRGLDPKRHDKEWAWAYGVGDAGWKKLGDWVRNGGTLVAIGSAVDTATQLLDLPIEKSLPEVSRRRGGGGGGEAAAQRATDADRVLRDAFSSPARLDAVLRERVIDPTSVFYCPGSLLQNEFNTAHPVAFGMPAAWPIFFETDQAYRLKPGFEIQSEVVSRYPSTGPILQSGWLLGEDLLRDQANVVAFRVGRGYVVTMGSQVDFRAQPRGTFKLLFNALFHGPSTRVSATELASWAVLIQGLHSGESSNGSRLGGRESRTTALLLRSDLVAQDADTFDFDFDRIAGIHPARGARRPGVDHVARLQRDETAHVADDRRHVEDQVLRPLRLHDLAIQARLQQQIAVVQTLDDDRSERTEGVAGLGAEPLEVGLLPLALADIVSSGDAKYIVRRVRRGDVLGAAANHDDKLTFVVRVFRILRQHDVVAGTHDGGRHLGEQAWIGCGWPLAEMGLVVQPDGDHLLGIAGCEHFDFRKLERLAGWFGRIEEIAGKLTDDLSIEDSIRRRAVG